MSNALSRADELRASANQLGKRQSSFALYKILQDRTAHGVRKAVANLLAEGGMSGYGVGAFLSHTETQTTEIYTRQAGLSYTQ